MRFTLKNPRSLQYIDYQNVRKTEFLGCQSQEIESQLAGVLVHPCTGPALQLLDLMRIRRHTDGLELTELPRTLVHHDHADRARFVSAPADKHARKGSQSEAIHPEKFPIL